MRNFILIAHVGTLYTVHDCSFILKCRTTTIAKLENIAELCSVAFAEILRETDGKNKECKGVRRKSAILVDFHTDYSEYWNCFHSLAIVGCVAYSTIVLNCSICLIWHLRNGVSYDQFFFRFGYLFTHRLRVMDTNFIKRHQFFLSPDVGKSYKNNEHENRYKRIELLGL